MDKKSKNCCYIGIDPGLSGAVAMINNEKQEVFNTPTVQTTVSKKTKNRYDSLGMFFILESIVYNNSNIMGVALEKVHAMPGQGVTSMFSMGEGFGIWKGIVASLQLPMHLVPPQTWKKAIVGTGKDKGASRLKAIELFPDMHEYLKLKKDHDKAEALLLAEYLRRLLSSPPL